MSFEQLQEEYKKCQRCPELVRSRTQVVFGSGNHQAQVLFIGEAPGVNEDKQGIPFCGMAGKILNELLAAIDLTREEVFVTNTIICRPPNNRNPAPEEVQNCRERLDRLIAIMQPKVIVTIGNHATERILGKKGITSLRGKIFPLVINGQEVKVVPVIHPANYLYNGRNPEILQQMKNDFQKIKEVITENKTPLKKQKSLAEF